MANEIRSEIDDLIRPATKEEFAEAKSAFSSTGWWVARVTYAPTEWDGENVIEYYKFLRAYEIRVSDFYGMDRGYGPVKEITIV